MKIDIFPHILPVKYKEALHKESKSAFFKKLHDVIPTLTDLDYRFRIMDKFEGLRQVLTIAAPPVENITDPQKAIDLARFLAATVSTVAPHIPCVVLPTKRQGPM